MMRAHVAYIDGDVEAAKAAILDVFDEDPFAPDVWDAFARFCADTDAKDGFGSSKFVTLGAPPFEIIGSGPSNWPWSVEVRASRFWAMTDANDGFG